VRRCSWCFSSVGQSWAAWQLAKPPGSLALPRCPPRASVPAKSVSPLTWHGWTGVTGTDAMSPRGFLAVASQECVPTLPHAQLQAMQGFEMRSASSVLSRWLRAARCRQSPGRDHWCVWDFLSIPRS